MSATWIAARPDKTTLNGPADDVSASEVPILQQNSIVSITAAIVLLLSGLSAQAEEDMNPAAMAEALQQASLPLEKATKVSEREGKPVSAKYEIENVALQLSIYTLKGDRFSDIIIDHKSGAVAKDGWITDANDMKGAQAQAAAMAKARATLDVATENAVKANAGYRAVRVMPMLEGGRPVAVVTLMKDEEVEKVTEKLDRGGTPCVRSFVLSYP